MKITVLQILETPHNTLRAWIEYTGSKTKLLEHEIIKEFKLKSIWKGADRDEFELISFEFDKEHESFLRKVESYYK